MSVQAIQPIRPLRGQPAASVEVAASSVGKVSPKIKAAVEKAESYNLTIDLHPVVARLAEAAKGTSGDDEPNDYSRMHSRHNRS